MWRTGDRLLVQYVGDDLLHERLLGARVGNAERHWVAATPDGDVYDEIYEVGATFTKVLRLPPSRQLPRGVREEDAYLFYNSRTATTDIAEHERRSLLARCSGYKDALENAEPEPVVAARRRVTVKRPEGAPPPRPGGPPLPLLDASGSSGRRAEEDIGADGGWLVADPSCGLALGSEVTEGPLQRLDGWGLARVDGHVVVVQWVRTADMATYAGERRASLHAVLPPGGGGDVTPRALEQDVALEKAKTAVARAQRATRSKADNDQWLKAQLAGIRDDRIDGLAADIFTDGGALRPKLAEVMSRLERLGADRTAEAGEKYDDARVLQVQRTPFGIRHRDFKSAVEQMKETSWEDWPLNGPRTTLFVCSFIAEHFGTPEQRHARFLADGRLQLHDVGVNEHAVIMKLLYFGAVYDQLDLPQLALAELACRRAQLIELKHKERFTRRGGEGGGGGGKKGKDGQSIPDPFDDQHLYLGLSATRGMLVISPELESWVGRELGTEYAAMKERRKALEERKLLKGDKE